MAIEVGDLKKTTYGWGTIESIDTSGRQVLYVVKLLGEERSQVMTKNEVLGKNREKNT